MRIVNSFILVFGMLLNMALMAEEMTPFAVGGKVGTLGLGIEGTVRIFDFLHLRLGYNNFDYSYDGTESDVEYDFELNLESITALVDFYPGTRSFHFTAGLVKNDNHISLDASSLNGSDRFEIGDVKFSGVDIGELSGDLDFEGLAPYLGIGFGNTVDPDATLTLYLDIGVVFQGSPDATLSSIGGRLSSNSFFRNELAKEEDNLESEVDQYDLYPVIAIGLSVHF